MNPSWIPVAALTLASAALGYVLAGPAPAVAPGGAPEAQPVSGVVEPAPALPSPSATPAPVALTPSPTPLPPPSDATPRTSRTLSLPQPVSVAPPSQPEAEDEGEDEREDDTPDPNDPPGGMTAEALAEQDMSALSPSDDEYDEVVEAQQRFHAWEQDILAQEELTPEVWAELQQKYAEDTQAIIDRAAQLNLDGHPAEAESLLVEWDSLEARYRKRVK